MYENLTEKMIESKQVYDGNLLKVYCDKVELPNGATSTRDYIKHNGAVAMCRYSRWYCAYGTSISLSVSSGSSGNSGW